MGGDRERRLYLELSSGTGGCFGSKSTGSELRGSWMPFEVSVAPKCIEEHKIYTFMCDYDFSNF